MKKLQVVLSLLLVLGLAVPALAEPLTVLTAPTLAVRATTTHTVTLRVTAAAAHGCPNGFTVQWLVVPQAWNGVWPNTGYSQVVLVGHNVPGTPFALLPGGRVDVTIGTAETRPTAAYTPPPAAGALLPGTQYAFRVFANSLTAAYQQSTYSVTVLATTSQTAPEPPGGGKGHGKNKPEGQGEQESQQRHGPGYWKNHAAWTDRPFFGTGKTWGQILGTPPKKGDTYYLLAHKYITAILNIEAGHTPSAAVTAALSHAYAYFTAVTTHPGVKANTEEGKINLQLAAILASWAAGDTTP
jgi:hypothetical protein